MYRIFALLFCAFCLLGCDCGPTVMHAKDAPVNWTGRVQPSEQGVSFDWSGTYVDIHFKGSHLEMLSSDTKRNYFNLWIDGKEGNKIKSEGDSTTLVLFDNPDLSGEHWVRIQKATEGYEGIVTIHSFMTDGEFLPSESVVKDRFIEFIGDSTSCGFGTESEDYNESFTPETENCKYSFPSLIANHFNADYHIIARSGIGLVRNWDDENTHSEYSQTLPSRYFQTCFLQDESKWNFKDARKPDVVFIVVGSNDFSTSPQPENDDFTVHYVKFVNQVREAYGLPNLPFVCVADNKPSVEPIKKACAQLQNVYFGDYTDIEYDKETEFGASYHRNRKGQLKLAAPMIEDLAAFMDWNH